MKKSSIYTKTGDKGTTGLVGGTRVPKTHIRLEAYGTVDELNSHIGWLNCAVTESEHQEFLRYIQNKLFTIGSYLATETDSVKHEESEKNSEFRQHDESGKTRNPKSAININSKDIERIEKQMDNLDSKLPKLGRFILPGGNEVASRAHICRTITRRAERNVYRVAEKHPVAEEILIFLNRLSDYLFLLARQESYKTSEELYWEKGDL